MSVPRWTLAAASGAIAMPALDLLVTCHLPFVTFLPLEARKGECAAAHGKGKERHNMMWSAFCIPTRLYVNFFDSECQLFTILIQYIVFLLDKLPNLLYLWHKLQIWGYFLLKADSGRKAKING